MRYVRERVLRVSRGVATVPAVPSPSRVVRRRLLLLRVGKSMAYHLDPMRNVPSGERPHPFRSVISALREAEAHRPRSVLLRWRGGQATVAEFAATARSVANGLRALGVQVGDRVGVLASNSERFVALWYGIYLAGAIEVPVNADLRGPMLDHVLQDSEPAFLLAEPEFLERVRAVARPDLRVIELRPETFEAWRGAPAIDYADPRPGDLATIMYTSGTTGPSKGVMLSHGYYPSLGNVWRTAQRWDAGDVLYFVLPHFHIDSHVVFAGALAAGATFAAIRRFSASRFWDDVAEFRATWFLAVGFMVAAVARQPAPERGRTTLRRAVAAPIPVEAYEYFEDRLGIPLYEVYGQTEADGVSFSTPERRRRGSAGWPCAGYEVVILGPDGERLPPRAAGEIAYRPPAAHMVLQGYWRREAATVQSFRDLWFHSGDLGHLDEDGFLWFLGRMRDVLRRRGENISAFELETTVRAAPGIADCAAVPVRDALGGEDEVKVFLALDGSGAFDAAGFFRYCEKNLARFAIPRFVEIVDGSLFVRSPGTGSIQKHLLPAHNGPHTIDRLALEGEA
jgi:carnitine-CoA ligase